MAIRRRKNAPKVKPVYRRRKYIRKKKAAVARVKRVLPGFPTSAVARLRFVDYFTFTETTGTMLSRAWLANGLYRPPKPPLAYHEPLGFTQWMAFYNKAYVLGAKITLQSVGDQGDAALPGQWIGIKKDDDATISSSYLTLKEQGCAMKLWQPKSDRNLNIKAFFSAKKWFKTNSIVGNDSYASTLSANPTKPCYFVAFLQSIDQVSNSPTCLFTATIDYYVKFAEPKDLPSS